MFTLTQSAHALARVTVDGRLPSAATAAALARLAAASAEVVARLRSLRPAAATVVAPTPGSVPVPVAAPQPSLVPWLLGVGLHVLVLANVRRVARGGLHVGPVLVSVVPHLNSTVYSFHEDRDRCRH